MNGCSIGGTMAAATPSDTARIENAGTLESRAECLVTDDRAIYDELIAPLEITMMRSLWRVVRNADLASGRSRIPQADVPARAAFARPVLRVL